MDQATTVLLTVISGVFVYSLGKLAEALLVDPLKNQRCIISQISERLVFNANLIHNPGCTDKSKLREAYAEYRELSGLLRSSSANIPMYWLLAFIPNTRAKNINEAAKQLMGLSNGPYTYEHYKAKETYDSEEKIKKLLKIHRFHK